MLPHTLVVLGLVCSLWTSTVFSLEVPRHTGPVVDVAGVLSRSDNAKISASLLRFQRVYGPQLQVLVVPKLEDETIETYSIKVVDAWKLGAEGKDDGVLLLVAGIWLQLHKLGLSPIRFQDLADYWPMLLVGFGLYQLMAGRSQRKNLPLGMIALFLGIWFQLDNFGLIRFEWWRLWPVLRWPRDGCPFHP